jgi:hypothetical protein
MTGPLIASWLREIADGQGDWYQTLPFTQSPGSADINTTATPPLAVDTTWESFVYAWIDTASVIQRSTPKSFRSSLGATDQWAEDKINNQTCTIVNNDVLNCNNIDMNDVMESIDTSDSFLSLSNKESSDNINSNNDAKISLVDQFKRLSQQFKGKQKNNMTTSSKVGSSTSNGSTHDRKTEMTTLCLWIKVSYLSNSLSI